MKTLFVLLGLAALFAVCECQVNPISITTGSQITGLIGPESVDVGLDGNIYVSNGDGSIKKIDLANNNAISVYAYSNPDLSVSDRAANCNMIQPTAASETLCGRPLGIKFDKAGNLYIADAYRGILRVPVGNTGVTEVLTTSSGGIPFAFTNALIINAAEDTIYFTDTSPTDRRISFVQVLVNAKKDGRLLKFDLKTNVTTTLLTGLTFANGIAFNKGETEIVINETALKKMMRYYITGTKAGTSDTFNADLGCYPDNVEADSVSGYLLVGCYGLANANIDSVVASTDPAVKSQYNNVTLARQLLLSIPARGVIPVLNSDGVVVKTLFDATGTTIQRTAEAKRIGANIYVGSVLNTYLARIDASLLAEVGPTTGTGSNTGTTSTTNAAASFQPMLVALFAVVAAILSVM